MFLNFQKLIKTIQLSLKQHTCKKKIFKKVDKEIYIGLRETDSCQTFFISFFLRVIKPKPAELFANI